MKIVQLIICILIPMAIGALGGIATASSVGDWYLTIQRPSFNPPNYLFGPVWSTLYLLMGISLYLIVRSPKSPKRTKALVIFGIQLVLNFAWSFLFFKFNWLLASFVEICMIWICILLMIIHFYRLHKIAGLIQIPYLLWVSFATVLNGSIWYLN